MEFLKQFLREHDMKLVHSQEREVEDLLLWAHRKEYIVLTKAPNGSLCFTQEDLDKAKMWREKDGD